MMAWTSFDETIKKIVDSLTRKSTIEYVGLIESSGRVLAQDVIAKESLPLFPTASMDGYAIRYEDLEKGVLKLVSHVPAGTDVSLHVNEGECIKTFTGSLMSEGADTLIPIENVSVKEDKIHINTPVKKGFAVRPVGESYVEGEVLIEKGETIGYAQIGVMAGIGMVQIPVFKKPVVAILATGSEIVDIGQSLDNPAQIRSSNHVTLAAITKENGAIPLLLGIAGDDKELIKSRILEGLQSADIVVTTGGVSVGDYDFVKDIIKDMEVETLVEGASIKPGRHIRVVKAGEKYIFALPGFPYSSSVTFFLYILPLIKYFLGQEFTCKKTKAIITQEYVKRSPFREFTACNLINKDGQNYVDLDEKKLGSSAILNNMLKGAALLEVPEEIQKLERGQLVDVILL